MWSIKAGTYIGPHHRKFGQPNQDAFGFKDEEHYKLLVAADGAGSLELSHLGAQIAVNVVKKFVRENHGTMSSRKVLEKAILAAREELLSQEQASQLGCTLAAVLLTEDHWVVAINGDAFAVMRDADELRLFTNPPAGEYANITKLLTSSDYQLLIESGDGTPSYVGVSTDGLVHAGVSGDSPFAGFWDPVAQWVNDDAVSFEALFAHMDEQGKIDDDTTLVMAVHTD